MDAKNAFLDCYLREEIYMQPPVGVFYSKWPCRLQKAFYGLNEAPYG